MTDIGDLPVEVVYPNITITDVNNVSIDNTTQTITGLQDDTLYNIRAVLRHNTTGVSKVIDRVIDDEGNIVEFRTLLNESIYMAIGGVGVTQTSLGFELREFTSNKSVNYDIEYFIYQFNTSTQAYTKLAQTQTTGDISNATFAPPVTAYPLVNFSNLTANTKYKVTAKVLNKSTNVYYNNGEEIVLLENQFTLSHTINYNINVALTQVTVNSITLHFTQLSDNTNDPSGVFNTIKFLATYEAALFEFGFVEVDRYNVPFFDTGDYTVTFSGLLPNTSYNFGGAFTRNTLYNMASVDFGYNVTTQAYAVFSHITNLNVSHANISFRFQNLTDNSGASPDAPSQTNFTYIHFEVFKTSDGSQVNGTYEYLDIPHFSTRIFDLGELAANTEYRVKATFHKAGLYTIVVDNLLTDTTLSVPSEPTFDATIILDDENIVTTTNAVSFTVVDFQSPNFADTENHTVTLYAVTPSQVIALASNDALHWDFSGDGSLIDYFNNEFVPSSTTAYSFDGTGLLTSANLRLQYTPADWGVFDGLSNNWRQKLTMTIPTSSVSADKFLTGFVNSTNNRGFRVHVYNTSVQFQGWVRLDDGNTSELLFAVSYDASALPEGGFFDIEHEYEFSYEGIELGSDSNDLSRYGRVKILIDGVEVKTFDTTNVNSFSESTISNGAYIPNTGYYEVYCPIPGTKLNNFSIGTNSTSASDEGIVA